MKLHLIKPFVIWVLKKIGAWFVKINNNYRKMMVRETGFAVFFYVFSAAVSTVLAGLFGVAVTQGSGVAAAYCAGTAFTISTIYFLYHAFSQMFEAFAKDRQELFNRLKD